MALISQFVLTSQKDGLLAFKTVTIQFLLLSFASLALLLKGNASIASSVFCGGLISILPTSYFALRLWPLYHCHVLKHSIIHLYRAWAGRFSLTIVLFIAVFLLLPPSSPKAFFIAFVMITLLQAVVATLLTICIKNRLVN